MRWSVLICTAFAATQAAYGSQSFTNESAFRTALGMPQRVYGFDTLAPGTVLHDQLAGVDFEGSGVVVQSGGAHSPPNVLGTTASPFSFSFDPGTRGVGFYNTSAVDEIVTYAAVGPGGTLFQALVPPGAFVGYIGDVPIGIGSIGWIGPPNSAFSIDTFIVGAEAGAVPALTMPFAWGLVVVLLAVAGAAIQRSIRSAT
jgi:hypothetical protein